MSDIREIPPMPAEVTEHRQQMHNLMYQIKYALDDLHKANSKEHKKFSERLCESEKVDRKQSFKINSALVSIILLIGGIAYLHSGASVAVIAGSISTGITLLAKAKGLL